MKFGEDEIIVFSFQEIVKLNTMNVLYRNKNSESITNWISVLSNIIGTDYFLVRNKALIGLLLVIFAKKEMKNRIRDISLAEKKLGFNNNFGNKGAVALRMDIDHSKLCFINCHLESGPSNLQRRIKQMTEIHKLTGFLSSLFDKREMEELKGKKSKV